MDQKKNRKPKNDPSIHRYSVNFNAVENARFQELFLKSGMKNRSKFIASMIFNREMKVVKIDKPAMDFYMRLTNLYTQYQSVGVNYNQTVKAVKTNFSEKRALSLLYRLEKETIQLVLISREVVKLTMEFEQKWLQK